MTGLFHQLARRVAQMALFFSPAALHSAEPKPAVVLLHGIYDSGKKMSWLETYFQQAGYRTFCPSLSPADGRVTIEQSAALLDGLVAQHFPPHQPLHVVGFSMGGLVTRYWLANYPVRSDVVSYATISAPHRGTVAASLLNRPGVIEMRRGSTFLQTLAAQDGQFAGLQPYSIYTPLDLIILPASSSQWPAARTEMHWSLLHPLMVLSPTVAARLLANMQIAEAAQAHER